MSEAKGDQKILPIFSGAGGITVWQERKGGFGKRARCVSYMAARNFLCSYEGIQLLRRCVVKSNFCYFKYLDSIV